MHRGFQSVIAAAALVAGCDKTVGPPVPEYNPTVMDGSRSRPDPIFAPSLTMLPPWAGSPKPICAKSTGRCTAPSCIPQVCDYLDDIPQWNRYECGLMSAPGILDDHNVCVFATYAPEVMTWIRIQGYDDGCPLPTRTDQDLLVPCKENP